jgi:hypothetical protein
MECEAGPHRGLSAMCHEKGQQSCRKEDVGCVCGDDPPQAVVRHREFRGPAEHDGERECEEGQNDRALR